MGGLFEGWGYMGLVGIIRRKLGVYYVQLLLAMCSYGVGIQDEWEWG